MKKLLSVIFVAVLCIQNAYSQSSWQIVNPPVNEDFVSICFDDESNGWIVSKTGTLVSTSVAGITWETISFPDYHFQSVHFSDIDHGCIVGWEEIPADSSVILVTNDGGSSWTMVDHVRVNRLNDVFFINNDIGWAVGAYDEWNLNCCLYTSSGGQNWYHQPSMSIVGAELFGVHFRDENIGQVCGTDGAFFVTNNGGTQSWAMNVSMPVLNLNALFNYGALTGCLVGDEGTALFTTNNWYQHIETVTNTTENLNGVSGDPATNKLWAVGNNGTIIYSPSYLLGWTEQSSGVTENLNDINMLSETNGWAVGDNGTFLHFSPTTSIKDYFNCKIEIYPNPTNDWLNIIFPEGNIFQQVQIVNAGGQVIYKENMVSSKDILLDVSAFLTGIYFLKIIGTSEIIVNKILIE